MSTSAADIARAEALGRLAASTGQGINTCPYPKTTPAGRVLALRWTRAYTAALPLTPDA